MNRKSSRPPGSIGIASVVLIFVMLCLMTFSVLSLMTARSDLTQSERIAGRAATCNEAENAANDILITVIQCMDDHLETPDAATFYQSVREQLDGRSGITFTDDSRLSYTVPCGEEQLLQVTLELSYEGCPDGRHYRVLAWNTEVTHEWDPDTPLPLYEPD